MALTKYKLGELIEQRREKYDGIEDLPAWGVSKEGFIPPKQEGADTSLYNVYYRNDFVFNPARMELNSIALNLQFDKAMCSSLYEIFYVIRTDIILPEYLNMFIKRDEFARKCWFEAIGSARNYFRVANLSEFEIELPSIEVQQKYVDIYNAMLSNQQSYERGLEDLKLVCDAYIENLRGQMPNKNIGKYIELVELKNVDEKYKTDRIRGISIKKEFIETKADTNDLSTKNYSIVPSYHFAFNPNTARMGDKFCIAINKHTNDILVSTIYPVFHILNSDNLMPEYLMMFFMRAEFDRYVRFNSWGSARETFNYCDISDVLIPIPNTDVQRSIVNIYYCYDKRKEINEKLKEQIKNICPILIKGSIEEGRRKL